FGVLVVQDANGNLGYLAAVSGKLADSNNHNYFVPPVYDILEDATFYLDDNAPITQLNYMIDTLEQNQNYIQLIEEFQAYKQNKTTEIEELKVAIVQNRAERKAESLLVKKELNETDFQTWEKMMIGKNLALKAHLKHIKML